MASLSVVLSLMPVINSFLENNSCLVSPAGHFELKVSEVTCRKMQHRIYLNYHSYIIQDFTSPVSFFEVYDISCLV